MLILVFWPTICHADYKGHAASL